MVWSGDRTSGGQVGRGMGKGWAGGAGGRDGFQSRDICGSESASVYRRAGGIREGKTSPSPPDFPQSRIPLSTALPSRSPVHFLFGNPTMQK